jgi:hypothetical protein
MRDSKHPRDTRTSAHLKGTSSKEGFDGVHFVRPTSSPPGHFFINRMSFFVTPKEEFKIEEVCDQIKNAPNNVLFFCDTSVFDDKTDDRLWEALFNKNNKVAIIHSVLKELEPWLNTHNNHIATDAIINKHPSIEFINFDGIDTIEKSTFEYYVNLLGFRKKVVKIRSKQFQDSLRRPPTEQELKEIKESIHKELGPRGYLMARKGAEADGSANFYTDEILVFHAVKTAIATGREVVILSKDEDIQEQFYKLLWLLDTHYRGMLLADKYASDPLSFRTHLLPTTDPNIDESFIRESGILIERSERMIQEILPTQFTFVPIQCLILGKWLTAMAFGAETEMARLLGIKGETGGLNTNRLNGRNCHLWLAPLNIPQRLRGCAVIAYDRRIKLNESSVEIPLFDANQTIYCQERYNHVIDSPLAW